MTEAWKDPECPPGRRYLLFKRPGEKTLTAALLMPNGHRETLDTKEKDKTAASAAVNARIRALYAELGIKTPREIRKETGELSAYKLNKQMKNGGPLVEGPMPIQPVEQEGEVSGEVAWKQTVLTQEQRAMMAMNRIVEMLILGSGEDPVAFRDHCRAIVAQFLHGSSAGIRASTRKRANGVMG